MFKTVAVERETCLPSEWSARRDEDGGRGRRGGGGVQRSRANGQRVRHTLSLIWQLPIGPPPINRLPGTPDKHNPFFSFLSRGGRS